MGLKMFSKNSCSTSFAIAFGGIATPTTDCLCGRRHFASLDKGCFEAGELERLLKKKESDPNRYIEHPNETSISYSSFFFGRQFVLDCPCGYAGLLEELIWHRQIPIATFLQLRAAEELNQAEAAKALAEKTAIAIKG
jgi:hypothetical protein